MSTLTRTACAASALAVAAMASGTAVAQADELKSIRGCDVYDTYGAQMVSKQSQYIYTGKHICPVSYLVDADGNRIDGSNCVKYYYKNKAKGTASVILKGINSKGYKDSMLISFKIVKSADIKKAKLAVSRIADQPWTGSAVRPALTVTAAGKKLTQGTDYTATYYYCNNVGSALVKVTGKGLYAGKTTWANYNIVKANVNTMSVDQIDPQKYTGSAITPPVRVVCAGKVVPASNYTVTYSNNVNPGTATITITGKGDSVTGVKRVEFKISKPFSRAVIASIPDQTWTGSEVRPSPLITLDGDKLVDGTDYFLSYENNIDASSGKSAICVVNPKGEYAGENSLTANFRIAIDLSGAEVRVPYPTRTYTGNPITQIPTVWNNGSAVSASNYTVAYNNNTNNGTAFVTITGTGAYKGSASTTFQIEKANIADASITVPSVVNIGSASKVFPPVTVTYEGKTLTNDVDYTLEYANNDNVGIGAVTISGKGNFTGQVSRTFTINR